MLVGDVKSETSFTLFTKSRTEQDDAIRVSNRFRSAHFLWFVVWAAFLQFCTESGPTFRRRVASASRGRSLSIIISTLRPGKDVPTSEMAATGDEIIISYQRLCQPKPTKARRTL